MNPVEEFLEEKEKQAGWLHNIMRSVSRVSGDVGRGIIHGAAGIKPTKSGKLPDMNGLSTARILRGIGANVGDKLTAPVVGVGIGATAIGTTMGARAVSERFQKQRDYEDMLQNNPSLRDHDAGQVQLVYNSLRRLSPDMAKDPVVSGSFVRGTLAMSPEEGPAIDTNTVKLLSETQRNVATARAGALGPLGTAFISGGTRVR